MPRQGKLTPEQQLSVVYRLACYDSPKVISDELRKEGVEITPQSIEGYDPTKTAGASLGPKLRTAFEKARAAFLADTESIPISHRAVRLRGMQRMYEKVESQGNIGMAMSILRQAAEETGGALTNKRELTGANGTPLTPTIVYTNSDAGGARE